MTDAVLTICLVCVVVATLAAGAGCSAAYSLRGKIERLRALLAEERLAAADRERRIIAVVVTEAGHDVALKAIDAAYITEGDPVA